MHADSVVEALEKRFAGMRFGTVAIRSVHAERSQDSSGDEVYTVHLITEDPAGPTWAVRDLTDLDLFANQVATEAGSDRYVYVNLTAAADTALPSTS